MAPNYLYNDRSKATICRHLYNVNRCRPDRTQFADDDYDDVSATIRIKPLSPQPNQRVPGVHVYSKTANYDADSSLPLASLDHAYSFSVSPGQVAIVKACSRSGAAIEIAVLEKDSGKLCWRCRKGQSRSPTLGICAIENNTPQTREFLLVGQKRSAADANPSPLPLSPSVLFEKESLVTVGFDDSKPVSDFDRVRVDILTMGSL